MNKQSNTVIVGTGSYLPERKVNNNDFLGNEFYQPGGEKFETEPGRILEKFEQITEIKERLYISDDQVTSSIAYNAALDAIESSGIDRESLDYIIVAHNFGDVRKENRRSDFVPSIAARVKHKLAVRNPQTVAYDVCFGCPGWLQGVIQAYYYLSSGDAKRALVIGAETLSRVSDPYDRDSLIYADGAGAVIIEARESEEPAGILSHAVRSDTLEHAYMLWMGESYGPGYNGKEMFLKMNGHKLYEYALSTVPGLVKTSLEKAGVGLSEIRKVLLHQANGKMDLAILKRLFKLYGEKEIPEGIMPMTISGFGNSSVATLPTLLDMLLKGRMNGHALEAGDTVVFASVGAGMNVNSVVYRIPVS